jgi:hypothetical protein
MFIKYGIFLIYACCLALLSLFKTAEMFLPSIYDLERFLGGDKLMHLKLSFILTLLALIAFNSLVTPMRSFAIRSLLIIFFITIGLLADELHQTMVLTRRFEWLDFSYGAYGVLIAGLAYTLLFMLLRMSFLGRSSKIQ